MYRLTLNISASNSPNPRSVSAKYKLLLTIIPFIVLFHQTFFPGDLCANSALKETAMFQSTFQPLLWEENKSVTRTVADHHVFTERVRGEEQQRGETENAVCVDPQLLQVCLSRSAQNDTQTNLKVMTERPTFYQLASSKALSLPGRRVHNSYNKRNRPLTCPFCWTQVKT